MNRQVDLALLYDIARRTDNEALNQFKPYDRQKQFLALTKDCPTTYMSACNGAGKTEVGAAIDAYHMLGEYPEDYEGYRLPKAMAVWIGAANPSVLSRALQQRLFCAGGYAAIKDELDKPNEPWSGLIPKRAILDLNRESNTNFVQDAVIRHRSGEKCHVRFFHYGLQATRLAGEHPVGWVHCDEIPPLAVWNELIARQRTAADAIKAIITATPEFHADQEMIDRLFSEEWTRDGNGQLTVSIDDVPEYIMSSKAKEQAKRETAPALAPAKLYGEPVFGAKLFTRIKLSDRRKSLAEFNEILATRPLTVVAGLDFGFNDATAYVTLYTDASNGVSYLHRTHKKNEMTPTEFCNSLRSSNYDLEIPTAWPHDGTQRNKREDKRPFIVSYREYGINALPEHVKKPVKEADKHVVWWDIEQKAIEEKFYVVDGNYEIENEWSKLRIGNDGKAKGEDHAMDALAVAWQARQFGRQVRTAATQGAQMTPDPYKTAQESGIPAHLLL